MTRSRSRSRSRSLAKVQEVAKEEEFLADWQSEEDRRKLLELTGLKGQEVVVTVSRPASPPFSGPPSALFLPSPSTTLPQPATKGS
jgi:hypothetical protein